jgi:outer membrane protein OmpA-like peptidoglycan-associated protein
LGISSFVSQYVNSGNHMRRSLIPSLMLVISAALPFSASAQLMNSQTSLAGTRELGVFASGRLLSTEYSADEGKIGFGGAVTFGSHLTSVLAVQGGIAGNYSRQGYSFYRPPLVIFTPTISLIFQRPTNESLQPYFVAGAGYEFIRFTHPRCDCDQSRSLGVANVGAGVRKMVTGRRALRFEVTSQIGKGGPAFTALAGMSWFLGTRDQFAKQRGMRRPDRVKKEPPIVVMPKTETTVRPVAPPPAPVTLPPAAPAPVPSNTVTRTKAPSPLPVGVGTVLLKFDGTQVDFTKPTWRDEAEQMLDGLVVDLTSDAGQSVKIMIEAHTDNIGSNAGNIMLGLDRARAVRDYFVSQGVASDRIRIVSSGEDAPIAPNTTAIGRQQNRRIIIKRDN